MTSSNARKSHGAKGPKIQTRDGILVRACQGIPEFQACIKVERAVWGSADIDLVPAPLFVVASETGGQVLGAFHGSELVGFTLAFAGWRDRKPFLHSHMTAVIEAYRDRGIGRRLKLFQRDDALARGISLIEWTFDPLITKNAHFNLMRLGIIARRYSPNAYGITTSPLHGALPTDRLVAEWHLRSSRVRRILAGKRATPSFSKKAERISVADGLEDLRKKNPAKAIQLQAELRERFANLLATGFAATAVARSAAGMDYILEPSRVLEASISRKPRKDQ
jgi:predicted GNAT superfamily acetyltransferase